MRRGLCLPALPLEITIYNDEDGHPGHRTGEVTVEPQQHLRLARVVDEGVDTLFTLTVAGVAMQQF
jgi:hypothetical protein